MKLFTWMLVLPDVNECYRGLLLLHILAVMSLLSDINWNKEMDVMWTGYNQLLVMCTRICCYERMHRTGCTASAHNCN